MIGQLKGIILEKQPPQLLLDVGGVGYEIDAPMSTFYRLPDIGCEVILLTHLSVREDAHHLFGFYTSQEKSLFRTLLKVNGVGPRLALTILSSVEPDDFVRAVVNNDTANLIRVPGIGKKTAERLIIEMRDKLSDWQSDMSFDPAQIITTKAGGRTQITQDAISALIALGYKPNEANRAIVKVDDGNLGSEELIRRALKEMMV